MTGLNGNAVHVDSVWWTATRETIMFPLRKESVHKCGYTNVCMIVSTLFGQQTRSPVSGSRSEGKVMLVML